MKEYHYEPQEQVTKTNRTARTLIIIMTIAFIIALIWGIWQNTQKRYYGALLENEYQRTFYSMVNGTEQIAVNSGKILASGGRQSNEMLHNMKNQADIITASLSSLPLEQTALIRTSQYFNQIGDYFGSLTKTLSDGEMLSEEDLSKLNQINQDMQELNEIIVRLQEKTGNGDISFTVGKSLLSTGIIPVSGDQDNLADPNSSMTYFNEVNDKLSLMEAMEYNGAYSSHMWNLEPKALTVGEDIGKEKAEKIAKEFSLLMTAESLTPHSNREIGEQTTMPAYEFTYQYGQNTVNIVVSKSGGKVLSAYNSRSGGEAALSTEEVIEKAERFLKDAGYSDMELIGQRKDDSNKLILNYARNHEDVLYYPDSLQLAAALDNGEILLFQANSYWMNYDENRKLPESLMEAATVQGSIAKGMEIGENRLALIADGAGNELLCHEYSCKIGEDEYMVYMNAEAGLEEQILRKYSSDDGFYTR